MLVAAIHSQWLVGVGIAHLAIFQDLQEECPILSLAQSGHIVFSAQQLGIIDSSEATYLLSRFIMEKVILGGAILMPTDFVRSN